MATTHLNTDLISSDYNDAKTDDDDDEDAMANVFDDDLGKKSTKSSPYLTCMHQSYTGVLSLWASLAHKSPMSLNNSYQ